MATLPPEIFQIICSHIPLYAHSPTILALAQTNHRLKEIVIPRLLYQHVWLGSEKHACQVLTKLKTQATEIVGQNNLQGIEIPTAHFVRRLCISCELFEDALISSNDSLSQLCALINLGGFPILASLAIHLSDGWLLDYQCDRGTSRFGYFFWRMLKEKCPNLREISLTGVMGDVHNSGLFEYEGLERFRLYYRRSLSFEIGPSWTPLLHKLFKSLTTFSPHLHTLEFNQPLVINTVHAENALFKWRFPHLRVLILHEPVVLGGTGQAAEFWSSHPNLERIEISRAGRWFEGLSTGILPKLRVLKAPFEDVNTLLVLLRDQLVNLTILYCGNVQAPYLLRSVLPNGLASLRSLGIYQHDNWHRGVPSEIRRWRDEHVGELIDWKTVEAFNSTYLRFIAWGAPNLEELELVSHQIRPTDLSLFPFSNLKRFYYMPGHREWTRDVRHKFLEDARDIADGCANLESVTEIQRRGDRNNHLSAKIHRGTDNTLTVREERGCGRVIGLEEDDFPGFL